MHPARRHSSKPNVLLYNGIDTSSTSSSDLGLTNHGLCGCIQEMRGCIYLENSSILSNKVIIIANEVRLIPQKIIGVL